LSLIPKTISTGGPLTSPVKINYSKLLGYVENTIVKLFIYEPAQDPQFLSQIN